MSGLLDSVPGTPSAISQMLGLLMQHPPAGQPGQAPPPPVAPTPMPNVSMSPAPVDQINAGMQQPEAPQSLLGKIHDFISDRVGIKEPGGYRGLLSPDEIRQAKPGILASGAGDSWSENLNKLLAVKGATLQAREHARIMESRAKMPQDLSLPDQLKYASAHGDLEVVKTLGGAISGMLSKEAPNNDRTPRTFTVDGKAVEGFSDKQGHFYTADGTQIPAGAKVTPYVAPHEAAANFTAVPGVGPDGKPVIFTLNTHTGKMESTGIGKPTAAGNAQGANQMAAAKANFESAQQIMDEYEAKLKAHPEIYGTAEATMGAMASSPTALTAQHPWDIPMSAAANQASSHLASSNPELMRYMTAKKLIAEAVLNTHKRPNQTQYEIEQELGGVGPNPSAMQIDMVSARRKRMYEEVFANPNAGAVESNPTTKAPSGKKDADYYLRKHHVK